MNSESYRDQGATGKFVGNRWLHLCLLLPLIALGSAAPKAYANDPFEQHVDKVAHFGLSAVMTESFMLGGKWLEGSPRVSLINRTLSSATALGVGAAKEIYDKRRGGDFSTGDLAADFLGVLTGNLLYWEF